MSFFRLTRFILENISGYERNVINEKLKQRKSLYFRRVFRNNISSLVVHKLDLFVFRVILIEIFFTELFFFR